MQAEARAREHYRARHRLEDALARLARQLWGKLDPANLDGSWARIAPQLLVGVAGSQLAAARMADAYTDDVLGDAAPAVADVVPDAFAGVASDGRPLDSLLRNPLTVVKAAIGQGVVLDRAMAGGYANLDMIVRTQLADAGRGADQAAIAARPDVAGYTRILSPPSCSRCVILAGRFYRWNAGFQRHPRCFPAGVVVDGPRSEAATRRLYQGELVVLATASGQKLPLTGNHPVLTRRGWVPARLLQEGDEVVRRTRTEGASPLMVPDQHQVPARIEDVWGSLGVPLLDAVESSPEDFHGDGQHGKVDVVRADGALDDGVFAALAQHGAEPDLARTAGTPFAFDGKRAAELLDLADAPHPGRPVRIGNLRAALLRSLSGRPHDARLALAAPLHSGLGEDAGDWPARDAVLLSQAELAGAGQVGGHDGLSGQIENLARWDAPDGAFSVETRGGYVARGLDLLQRLSGQIELDRVVEVRRVEWSGHVYSLTSSEGWHSANSLIVSNCDCLHVPAVSAGDGVRTDPRGYFDSLSHAEQDKTFTRAGAEAIRDGADMARVVNARRGMYEAGGKLFTTEAATRAGVNRRIRMMPEQIYREAGDDRDEAIRLLRAHGYLRGTPTRAVPRAVPAPRPIPAPRAPSMSPEAARYQLNLKGIEDLAGRVEDQLSQARRSGIHEGIQGDKKKLRWPDGVALFSKSYADDVWKLGATKARYTVDAEQLAGVLGHALGVNVPRVFRRDEFGIFTDWSTDAPQFRVEKRKDGFDVIERAMASDDGVRIGLLDMLTGNIDRHSGNILIGAGGKVTGIDQGLAWSGALDRLATVGSTEFAESASVFMLGPAKVHFVDGSRISGFGDNPLTRADIAWIRRRMNSLRPLFEHLGRGGFLDYSNAVLDLLERHAKGSRRIFGA